MLHRSLAVLLLLLVCTGLTRANADQESLVAAIEAARVEAKIPGCALVIVKDDRIVLSQGFGLRDVEKNLPVTADTLFAIGSCSKAFTAMAVAIGQDEGKLSLEDSPRKFLPDFKLQDPEADQKITLRDMLCHRSGLGGTDLAWYTGVLTRDEAIQVAGIAKPTAPFRAKWQYQNVMYSAAGHAAAAAYGTTWEQLVAEKILRPLGMSGSNFSVKQMQQVKDFARGYSYDMETKETRPLPMRDLTNIAPAGAINSSANDMAKWARLMLGRGQIDGRRIVSEDRFKDLVTPQMEMGPGTGYSLGWLVHKWHGSETWEHGGGIDGFNAFVVIVPEKKLGYVLLTNVSASPLNSSVREIIWRHLIDPTATPATAPVIAATQPTVDPQQEVGKYGILEVVFRDGSLYAIVAGQPDYKLENVGGRRYRLASAPAGFFVTFRESKEPGVGTEVYLEQPHGNHTFPREPSAAEEAAVVASYSGANKDLLGTYSTGEFSMDITVRGGKVVAIVKGQPTYTLVEKAKNVYTLSPLPDSFELTIRRDDNGGVTGGFLKQPRPQPDLELKRTATPAQPLDVDKLIQRAIDAAGGEANLRRHRSLTISLDLDFENQGLTGRGTTTLRAPGAFTKVTEFHALGKPIGSMTESFDGTTGRIEGTFMPPSPYRRAQIAEAKALFDLFGPAGWKEQFKTITPRGKAQVREDMCDVLEMKSESGTTVTSYISEKTALLLRRDFTRSGEGGGMPVTELFSDFRAVDGVMLPFRIEQKSMEMGRVVQTVKEAKLDGDR